MLRDLFLNWQISRDIKRNIAPARKARQEAAKRGQHTRWANAGKKAREMFP